LDGSLKQLHAPSGGDWGGVGIDFAFFSLLEKIFGKEILNKFKETNMYNWLEFQNRFEREKRKMKLGKSLLIELPSQLTRLLEMKTKHTLKEAISQTDWVDKISYQTGANTIELTGSVIENFFESNIQAIITHVSGVLQLPNIKGLKTILLVGGFAESSIVNAKIKEAFRDEHVVVPNEAGCAVLKGAVIFGHNPRIISARVSPYTYGLHTRRSFNTEIDDESRKIVTQGKAVVENAFDKHIEIGEIVYVAKEPELHNFTVLDMNKPDVFWRVYRSSDKDPLYCDLCEYVGKLSIHVEGLQPGTKKTLGVRMICRGTELEVVAIDKENGKFVGASFDFLKR
jgi:hypothetical protein